MITYKNQTTSKLRKQNVTVTVTGAGTVTVTVTVTVITVTGTLVHRSWFWSWTYNYAAAHWTAVIGLHPLVDAGLPKDVPAWQ